MRRLMSVIALVAAVTVPQVAFAGSVAVTYAVGHLPFGVVVDPADGHVYVSNNGGTTISVVDPAAGTVRSVDVGMQPGPMALDSAGRRLYVSNFGDMTVTVLNLTTLTQVTTSYDGGGLGVAVDPAANMFFAARGTEFVSIDTRTFGVRDFVSPSAAQGWFGVAVDPGLHRVYVTNIATAAPTLEVLNEATLNVIAEVALPKPVRFAFAVDPTSHSIYLASEDPTGPPFAGSELYVVDPTTFALTRAPLGGYPGGLALGAGAQRMYVTVNSPSSQLLEVDTHTLGVLSTTALPWAPQQAAVHPDGRVYVAGSTADALGAVSLQAQNQAPVIDSVAVNPLEARTNDVVAAAVTAHDPDGDPITLSYQWAVNRIPVAGETAASIDLSKPGNGNRDDSLCLTVTASDGKLQTSVFSCYLVILDTAPVGSVSLSTSAPATNAVVTATATASDADGDTLTYAFTWKVNGLVRKTTSGPGTTETFDLGVAGNGDHGDALAVELVVSDDRLSSGVSSATATVANTPPTVTLDLSDATPQKKETLVATATGRDADAGPLSYTFVWRVNGSEVRTTTTQSTTDNLDVHAFATNGDRITVTVVATDGFAFSAQATASATVTPGGGGSSPGDR